MAEMVWCQSCKKVVWAYDHQPRVDLRGICNMLQLPCPKCGEEGNFNGWGSDHPVFTIGPTAEAKGVKVSDAWSAMHFIASLEGMEWDPSKDNRWFPKGAKIMTLGGEWREPTTPTERKQVEGRLHRKE